MVTLILLSLIVAHTPFWIVITINDVVFNHKVHDTLTTISTRNILKRENHCIKRKEPGTMHTCLPSTGTNLAAITTAKHIKQQ